MRIALALAVSAGLLALGSSFVTSASTAEAQATAASQKDRNCTFQSLSAEDQRRYRSRYQRRVRVDGQAYADQWIREEMCPTPEQARPRSKGKNCRAVSRPVTSMDGSMTVGIGRKCD